MPSCNLHHKVRQLIRLVIVVAAKALIWKGGNDVAGDKIKILI